MCPALMQTRQATGAHLGKGLQECGYWQSSQDRTHATRPVRSRSGRRRYSHRTLRRLGFCVSGTVAPDLVKPARNCRQGSGLRPVRIRPDRLPGDEGFSPLICSLPRRLARASILLFVSGWQPEGGERACVRATAGGQNHATLGAGMTRVPPPIRPVTSLALAACALAFAAPRTGPFRQNSAVDAPGRDRVRRWPALVDHRRLPRPSSEGCRPRKDV